MNIGEISKPSVERAQIGKKIEQQSTNAVTESKQVVDSVELSDESKRRYKKKERPEKVLNKDDTNSNTIEPPDSQSNNDRTDKKTPSSKGLNIDLRA